MVAVGRGRLGRRGGRRGSNRRLGDHVALAPAHHDVLGLVVLVGLGVQHQQARLVAHRLDALHHLRGGGRQGLEGGALVGEGESGRKGRKEGREGRKQGKGSRRYETTDGG